MIHPRDILKRHQIRPKKSLGQNFLFDDNILKRIVEAAELRANDHVLEIGPGLGSLTLMLAQRCAAVVAVEIDSRFMPILEAELGSCENVRLVEGDILERQPGEWFAGPYKVVANVPYYITGATLRHLLSADQRPTHMVLTVQKEVAERMAAAPPQMSLMAVSVQYYGIVTQIGSIKAGAFWPRPDVDSAIVRVDLRPQDEMQTEAEKECFFRVVRAGFAQKRKQLKNNLRLLGYAKSDVALLLEATGVDGRRRAETLTLGEWRRLSEGARKLGTTA